MTTIDTFTGGDEKLKSRLEGLAPEQKVRLLEILKQGKKSKLTTINTPTDGDEKLKSRLEGLAPEQKVRLLEILKQDKESKLFGKEEKILNNLKKSVRVEKNAEIMGYKGEKVHIELPAVGKFEGFKFDCFVSDEKVSKKDFEKNPELEKKSYSIKEVRELIKAMNTYMQAMGVETNGGKKYDNKYFDEGEKKAVSRFGKISGLRYHYWLKDKNVDRRYEWLASALAGIGQIDEDWLEGKLLLKLPD